MYMAQEKMRFELIPWRQSLTHSAINHLCDYVSTQVMHKARDNKGISTYNHHTESYRLYVVLCCFAYPFTIIKN